MSPFLIQSSTLVLLLLVLAIAGWVGLLAGRRIKLRGGDQSQFGIILSAILAILGLLLGFTYSGSMARFTQRQEILVREANAIGTAWLRTDLLNEPHRGQLRSLLRDYTDARISLFNHPRASEALPVQKQLASIQGRIWETAVAGVKAQPSVTIPVLGPINEVIDLLAIRNAAVLRHTPMLVLGVLFACALAAVGAVGFGLASADQRVRIHAAVLGFLIAAAIWVTIDMDFPSFGMIRVGSEPLDEVRASMKDATP